MHQNDVKRAITEANIINVKSFILYLDLLVKENVLYKYNTICIMHEGF